LRQGDGGMRGDPDSAGDLFAPIEIREEVLAEPLTSHEQDSVAAATAIPDWPDLPRPPDRTFHSSETKTTPEAFRGV
ncbi:MAG TPA: hypothetical protein VF740_01365, partial [Candidatus Acidoferrum sp.]